ncbi:MAG: DUF2752 domain-containing protein [Defluviitaleaceae bacterium]|nr:DUF2752 domain-containing protein [Defluviitaleaceae bacterium]MCL2273796.1 DUF2752 domain-containing protein [Defluviitaleaceae bacterium]
MKSIVKLYVILVVIGGIALVLSLFTAMGFPCPLYHIAGIPCPVCGLTRAFITLAGGDIWGALVYHPLFWSVPLLPLVGYEKIPIRTQNYIWIGIGVVFGIVWLVRMLMFFPHTPPMNFNYEAVIMRFLNLRP